MNTEDVTVSIDGNVLPDLGSLEVYQFAIRGHEALTLKARKRSEES